MLEKPKRWGITYTRTSHEHVVVLAPTRDQAVEILNNAEFPDELTVLSDAIYVDTAFEQCQESFLDLEGFSCSCEKPLGHTDVHSHETFDELAAAVQEAPRAKLLKELHSVVHPGEYGLGSEPESMSVLDEPTLEEDADYTEVEAYLEELKPWLEQEKRAWARVGELVDRLLELEEEKT